MAEDEQLYLDFLNGNQNSFEIIVNKYAEKLIYFIYKYVNDFETAKDLSQDVFLYLIKNKENFRFECSFKSYLYIIARSRSLTYLKQNKKFESLEDEDNSGKNENIKDIEEAVFEKIRNENLLKTIKSLKPEYRKNVIFSIYRRFKL